MKAFAVLTALLCANLCIAFPNMPGDPCNCPIPGAGCSSSKQGTAEAANGTAADKLTDTWNKMLANSKSRGYMNNVETLIKSADKNYLWNMQDLPTEEQDASHQKITHGIGGTAKVHFEWCDNAYTGMFKKADNCVIRIANAAKPTKDWLSPQSWNPNMGIKCFRDGDAASANMLQIWEIDGYNVIPAELKDSCSFFGTPMSNHCGLRDDINKGLRDVLIPLFQRVEKRAMLMATSPFAEKTQDGSEVAEPNFPFAVVMRPHPDLDKVPCKFDDMTSQLLEVGQKWQNRAIFEIFAVHDPWYSRPEGQPTLTRIGKMVLDSPFITSMYGDTQLFFRHRFFTTELQVLSRVNMSRAKDWDSFTDYDTPEGLGHGKVEGAAWYQPFIPSNFEESCSASELPLVV